MTIVQGHRPYTHGSRCDGTGRGSKWKRKCPRFVGKEQKPLCISGSVKQKESISSFWSRGSKDWKGKYIESFADEAGVAGGYWVRRERDLPVGCQGIAGGRETNGGPVGC